MKRRVAIKTFFFYGLIAAGIGSLFEFIKLYGPVDRQYIHSRKKIIEQLAGLIIPATGTPGAIEAGAADYIIKAVSENLSRRDANNFIDGLRDLESLCNRWKGKPFLECSEEDRTAVLLKIRDENVFTKKELEKKVRHKILGNSFFETLKQLTVIGYCTSEIGATKGLSYIDIPVHYLPCIPLEKEQKCWATK